MWPEGSGGIGAPDGRGPAVESAMRMRSGSGIQPGRGRFYMECSDGRGSGGRFSTSWLMCGGGAIGIMKAVADAAAISETEGRGGGGSASGGCRGGRVAHCVWMGARRPRRTADGGLGRRWLCIRRLVRRTAAARCVWTGRGGSVAGARLTEGWAEAPASGGCRGGRIARCALTRDAGAEMFPAVVAGG